LERKYSSFIGKKTKELLPYHRYIIILFTIIVFFFNSFFLFQYCIYWDWIFFNLLFMRLSHIYGPEPQV
jgi:hypothetical protein